MKNLTNNEIMTVFGGNCDNHKNMGTCWIRCQYIAHSPDITEAEYSDFFIQDMYDNEQCSKKREELQKPFFVLWCNVMVWPSENKYIKSWE